MSWMGSMADAQRIFAAGKTTKSYLTKLPVADELEFRSWVDKNKIPFDPSPMADYDMRGFWQGLKNGDPRATTAINPHDNQIHFTDTWKTPYHKTFSNESIYAPPDAPRWMGDDKSGWKLVDKNGNIVYDESK